VGLLVGPAYLIVRHTDMIEKAAKARQRSKRKDPAQEAIVQGKDAINERTSKLIELLKELKRGWNGGPAPEIGISEKYNLTQPMPDEVANAAGAAQRELDGIIQGVRQLDTMQDNYSVGRTQKITERAKRTQQVAQQAEPAPAAPPAPTTAAIDFEFKKEASNPLTRAWSWIVAPFHSEKGKWDRLRLLSSLARIDSNLKDIDENILSGDPAILNSLYIAKQMYLDAKGSFFDAFRKNLYEMLDVTRVELEKMQHEIEAEKDKQAKQKIQVTRETAEKNQGPLRTGPISMPSKEPSGKVEPKPESEKENALKKMQDQLQSAVAEIANLKKQRVEQTRTQEDLVKGPVRMPDFSQQTGPQTLVDALRSPGTSKTPPKTPPVTAPPTEKEPEKTPPATAPVPDPMEKKLALRKFIAKKTLEMYNHVSKDLHKYHEAPEPWATRIRNQWTVINTSAQDVQALIDSRKGNDRQWIIAYMSFVKAVGDLNATVYALENEMKAAAIKPDFQFGVTLDETNLENQARNFSKVYGDDVMKIASTEPALIAQGSATSRWVKRMLTHLSWKRDKHLRLQLDRYIKKSRDGLQALLNNLEKKNINFRSLIGQSDDFYASFIEMFDKLADLAESYNSRMRIEKSEKKSQQQKMLHDIIPNGDINTMRTIRNLLQQDRIKIKALEENEIAISNMQRSFEKLKDTGVDVGEDIPGEAG
jgi:hypothetical protein